VNSPEIDAARVLLARLGVTPEQLLQTKASPPVTVPTFAEYIEKVSRAVPEATRRAYRTYWRRITDAWGDRPITEPKPLDIAELCELTKNRVVTRRNSRGGRSAAEHLISALRCLYRHAENDGIIKRNENPALKVTKPRRLPSTRRAIPDKRLAEIHRIAAITGNDPELDALLLRLHTETACRRGGALALTPADLDPDQCLIRLTEKGETVRWQPVSPSLMRHLTAHNHARGGAPDEQLLRYVNGNPITARRYDHLRARIGRYLPWVATQQISTHWLRHTTLTWVERHFGYAIARAYAGHTDNGNGGTTATYVRADLPEIAAALATLTGEPHPLAVRACSGRSRAAPAPW
jgi:integrase/recombinase XerC